MVYIIGTGPGDEDLLTTGAIKALEKCTVVLYDRLVSNNILNYVKEDCKIYYCGKEPGNHYKSQEEINETLVKLAKEGHIVGRIKGGDPYVFGRGGEEAMALLENNLKFKVISGVTSPISVLNHAGIPVTYRGIAQSFHVITGMTLENEKINWSALAKEQGTLIFLMGIVNLSRIVEALIKNGKDEETPVAVVMRGSSSKQRKVIGVLNNIVEKVQESKITSPAIIVMGEVVLLNDRLNWYEKLPFFGKNICITRTKEQGEALKNRLKELGAEVTLISAIKVLEKPEALDNYLDKLEDYQHIVLTSKNAVKVFFNYLISKKYDIRNLKAKFSVIGSSTGKALEERGIFPEIMGEDFYSEGLLKALLPKIIKGEKVLIPTSAKAKTVIEEKLRNSELIVDRVNIYDVICGENNNRNSFEEVDIILFTSPSTVHNYVKIFGALEIKKKISIAIGPETKNALDSYGISCRICSKATEEGFIEEIQQIVESGQ